MQALAQPFHRHVNANLHAITEAIDDASRRIGDRHIDALDAMAFYTLAQRQSCEAQKKGVTTFIEVILNQELGEPFRRDAMKKPTVVAGIRREDMRAQEVA